MHGLPNCCFELIAVKLDFVCIKVSSHSLLEKPLYWLGHKFDYIGEVAVLILADLLSSKLKNVVAPTPAYMLALERPHFFGRSVAPSVGIIVT